MLTIYSDSDFQIGIKKCLLNAESLIADAILLKENGRLSRAHTLFQLAIEELGKTSVLYFFAILNDADKKVNIKKFQREFSSHKIKTGKAINFDAIILMSIKEKTERLKFLQTSIMEHMAIETYNELKNYSLYTSLIGDKFLMPSEVITEAHVTAIEARATLRFEIIKSTMEFLAKSIAEVKDSNFQIDSEQIQKLADDFLSDFFKGDV